MRRIDLPTVTRVHTDTGSHLEPPLEQGWDEAARLAWRAAVSSHDTGVSVQVDADTLEEQRGARRKWHIVPGMYNLTIGPASYGPMPYGSAWTFLNGAEADYRGTTVSEAAG
jgi:hypothetical protein